MTTRRSRTVAKSKQPNPFTGRWRIVSMEQWDQDFVDEEEEGYFEFDEKGRVRCRDFCGHSDCLD
jgi:hypothetical protein